MNQAVGLADIAGGMIAELGMGPGGKEEMDSDIRSLLREADELCEQLIKIL